ncbi:MAG TPA: MmgE/PrpD family protein [Chloroflexota bacterium]|nr:MmgE/PrpD family protein [Chloroflexota bacterium]
MTDSTGKVAEFVSGLSFSDLTPSAVRAAKDVMLDAIGVALAGSHEEDSKIVAGLARQDGGTGESTAIGHAFQAPAAVAAFVNGVAVHALDFDSSFVTAGQPMAGLTPAVLATAESCNASGAALITAYVTGYEVTAKIVRSMPANNEDLGWHSTGSSGSVGTAAAVANLLRLGREQTRATLGIVASMASGLVANFGTMSKPLHAGLAARNGVQAARLAQQGFTGNRSSLESGSGYFHAFSHGQDLDLSHLSQMGAPFEVEHGVRYKPYPCGGLVHSAIDAILALRQQHESIVDGVERIDVAVTRQTASRIIFRVPETGIQGKFCLPYIMARCVVDGHLAVDTFNDEAVRDPGVLALASRVTMAHDPSLETDVPGSRPAVVTIRMQNGTVLQKRVDFARGGAQVPLSPAELRGKFTSNARRVLSESSVSELLAMLDDLEHAESVRSITEILAG